MSLVYLAGAWLLGVAGSAASGGLWWPGVAAIAVAGIAASALERRPGLAIVGLLAAGLFVAGGARYIDAQPADEPGGIAAYNAGAPVAGGAVRSDEPVRLRALVTDEPALQGASQRVRLEAREVLVDGAWAETSGGVLLRAGLFPRYAYGDVLELEGVLETPPTLPDFDYRDYLARQGVVSLLAFPEAERIARGEGNAALAALHDVRGRLGDGLAQALPEPQAALAQGIFLGQRSAIPDDLTDDLNATGTSHLVAISGHNVSLVAALVIAALAWLIGRRQAAIVALVTIAGYTALTGASPTVVRAAIMGGLFIVATLAGRPSSAAPAIALSAAAMTAWDPLVIEDVSFQLSFAAIMGLVYLSPSLEAHGAELLRRWGVEPAESGVASFLLESTAVTAGAVAATLPLIALYFGRVSLVTFVANLVLVPAFPLILGSSALTAAAGALWAPLGDATGWLSWAALTYMIEVARFFAALPLASFEVSGFGKGHAAAAYVALVAIAWWLTRRPRPLDDGSRRESLGTVRLQPAWLAIGGLALAASLAWWAALDSPDGRLRVSVLDVGQGDAILIEAPDGRHVLVDGGPDGESVLEAVGEELPFWERTIDLVALSHPQEDHVAGLVDVLGRYDVGLVLSSPAEGESAAYTAWRELIARRGLPYRAASAGDAIDLGDGATLTVLGPDAVVLASGEPNDASLVLMLRWRDVAFLLTGDIERAAEEALVHSDAEVGAQVLKVAHHGSATSTSAAFLDAVNPEVAVISAGEGNRFGHPSASVLERLEGTLVLRTDEHGTITFTTDGRRLWVEAER